MVDELNEHLVEVGRMALHRAFHIPSKQGSSSISYFAGQKRPEKHQQKPKRWEIPDDGDSSEWAQEQRARLTRRKWGDDELHATATRAPGFSRPPIPDWTLISGSVLQAIADLPPLEFLWVHYCYRAPGYTQSDFAVKFHRAFFLDFEQRHLSRVKAHTRLVARNLLAVAMQNESQPGANLYPDVDPEDRRNWKKTYRPHFFQMRVELQEIDRSACHAIGEKLVENTHIDKSVVF